MTLRTVEPKTQCLAQYTDAEAALYAAYLVVKLTTFKYAMYDILDKLAPEDRDRLIAAAPCSYSASTLPVDAMKRCRIYNGATSLIENEQRAEHYLFPDYE
jgi:hypothetical protein